MAASDPTDIPASVPGDRVDALYGLALDEFTRGRDALAKDLRASGDRAAADWVKALRKPSAPAWVANQLARTQAREAKRLLETGDRLRRAQEQVLAGDASAGDLRTAAEEAAGAQDALLEKALGLLDHRGHPPSDATVGRVKETLQAVPLDERARAEFAAGRLTREQRATGFGLAGAASPPAGGRTRSRRTTRKRGADERARARDALKDAKARHREASHAVTEAERDVEKARRDAERAQRRLEDASRALEDARAGEEDAQRRVDEAGAAVERARS
jgi:hypothetical protein